MKNETTIFDQIEQFCEEKGKLIAKILLNSYDSADFETDQVQIEKEIYDISVSYAKLLLFESNILLKKDDKEKIKLLISYSFHITERKLQKLSDAVLIAYWIKLNTIRELEKNGIVWF